MLRYHNENMSETRRIRFHQCQSINDVDFCESQLNLLAHAQAIELDIGSRCGGHGICGGDRVKIDLPLEARHQLSRITEDERKHLTDEELREGWRLACQCFPQPDTKTLEIQTKGPGDFSRGA